ncbi:MAG: hypothetical protein WCK78_08720 [Paludibacter sp.]
MIKKLLNRRDFVKTLTTVAASSAIPPFLFGERVTFLDSTLSSKPKETELSKQISEQKTYLALGKPNPDIPFTAGLCSVFGKYTADSKITFEGKCQNPWEFMATGTGVSGLTISAGREVTGQLNHSAVFDENDILRSLGRFKLDWYDNGSFWSDQKFSGLEKQVSMVHDLRRSVIAITSEGGKGKIILEVRAHKELDVIRIDISEETSIPNVKGTLHLQLHKDYSFEESFEDNIYKSWHTNKSGKTANRCFGTAMSFDVPKGVSQKWTSGRGTVEKGGRYTLWIVAGSNGKGFEAWSEDVDSRLAKARSMGDKFITSHEMWWKKFWERSSIVFPGDDGSYLRHQAAFELYRYYMACSTSSKRETPLGWFNDVLGYNEASMWTGVQTNSIENYQGWYGTVRAGDLDTLGSQLQLYSYLMPAMKRWVQENFGHDGAVVPYTHNVIQPFLGSGEITTKIGGQIGSKRDYGFRAVAQAFGGAPFQLNTNGNLFILLLFCDYASLSGDKRFIKENLFPYASGAITYYRMRYPERTADGHIDFTPSNAQEGYFFATDSAELIVGMKSLLPRLLVLGKEYGWDKSTLVIWKKMLNDLPELPRGSIKIHETNDSTLDSSYIVSFTPMTSRPITLEKSDLLAPVRILSSDYSRTIDRQLPELDSIWPGKLMLRNKKDHDVAVRSYHARLFKHVPTGWSMDVVHAACLGLKEEVRKWWSYHFDTTYTFPCGLAQDLAPYMPDRPGCPFAPNTEGLGTGVLPVLEMLLQDYPDLLIVLPCWESNVAVRYTLYSPYAGKVMVDYDPQKGASVQTERPIKIEYGEGIKAAKA